MVCHWHLQWQFVCCIQCTDWAVFWTWCSLNSCLAREVGCGPHVLTPLQHPVCFGLGANTVDTVVLLCHNTQYRSSCSLMPNSCCRVVPPTDDPNHEAPLAVYPLVTTFAHTHSFLVYRLFAYAKNGSSIWNSLAYAILPSIFVVSPCSLCGSSAYGSSTSCWTIGKLMRYFRMGIPHWVLATTSYARYCLRLSQSLVLLHKFGVCKLVNVLIGMCYICVSKFCHMCAQACDLVSVHTREYAYRVGVVIYIYIYMRRAW